MKKILAAMLAVAMIFSMSCVALADENAPFPDGVISINDPVRSGEYVTVTIDFNDFTTVGAAGTIVVKYDSSKLTYNASIPNLEQYSITFKEGTFDEYSLIGAGHADTENSQINLTYAGAAAPGVTWENTGAKTGFTLRFKVNEGATGDASFTMYHGSEGPNEVVAAGKAVATKSINLDGSTPVTSDEPAASDTPAASDAPAASDTPATPAGTDKPATPGSTGSTTPGTTGGATGGSTGGATGGSTSASSTTAAKTADTAPIVTMAVLALAAGTVVVAMRKRVNG